MIRLALFLLAIIALAGCSAPRWTWQHPDNPGPEKLTQDQENCETISSEEMTYPYPSYGYRHHYHYYRPWPYYAYDPYWHYYDYWPYGYGWYDDPFAYRYYRDDLFRVCMRAKGWQQVPVEDEESSR